MKTALKVSCTEGQFQEVLSLLGSLSPAMHDEFICGWGRGLRCIFTGAGRSAGLRLEACLRSQAGPFAAAMVGQGYKTEVVSRALWEEF